VKEKHSKTRYCLVVINGDDTLFELDGSVKLPKRDFDSLDDIGTCVSKITNDFAADGLVMSDIELVGTIRMNDENDEITELKLLVPIKYELTGTQRFSFGPLFVASEEDKQIHETAKANFMGDMPYIKFRRLLAGTSANYCVFYGLNAVSIRKDKCTVKYFFDPFSGNMELIRIVYADSSRKEINLKTRKTRILNPDILMQIKMQTNPIEEEEFD